MLRLGSPQVHSYGKWLRRHNYRQNLQIRKTSIFKMLNLSTPTKKFTIYIPNHWSCFLIGSKNLNDNSKIIYLKSNKYFFKIPYIAKLMKFSFDVYTHSINILLPFKTHYIYLYLKNLQQVLFLFSQIQFMRMKFRGKGYYIYRTLRNTVAPNFGYAHRVYVYAYYISLKFLSKTSILLFGLNKKDLFRVGYSFKGTRPINIFTGRGVRFVRQIVYKKVGKVSSYR